MSTRRRTVRTLISIELEGLLADGSNHSRGSDAAEICQTCCRQIAGEGPDGEVLQRLVVSVASRMLDEEQANQSAGLLYDHLERLMVDKLNNSTSSTSSSNGVAVTTFRLAGLGVTVDGIASLKAFLELHSATMQHVMIKDVQLAASSEQGEHEIFATLAGLFSSSHLESLHLSRIHGRTNPDESIVGNSATWQSWLAGQSRLRKLILDYIRLDDAAMMRIASLLRSASSQQQPVGPTTQSNINTVLEEFQVVLMNALGPEGNVAANELLQGCSSLSFVRWVYKRGTKDAKLPWFGLRQLAAQQQQRRGDKTLQHVVMEGSRITERELGEEGLCGMLQDVPHVQTLKLRNLGLIDEAAKDIVAALFVCQPYQLRCLDLGYNSVGHGGARHMTELVNLPRVMHSLKVFRLDHNKIDSDGVSVLLDVFGASSGYPSNIDLDLQGNAVDYSKLYSELQQIKLRIETERDELSRSNDRLAAEANQAQKHLREITAAQTTILADFHILQQENRALKEERDALMRTISIMGSASHMEQATHLFDRVNKLEEMVFSNAPHGRGHHAPQPRRQSAEGRSTTRHGGGVDPAAEAHHRTTIRSRSLDLSSPLVATDPSSDSGQHPWSSDPTMALSQSNMSLSNINSRVGNSSNSSLGNVNSRAGNSSNSSLGARTSSHQASQLPSPGAPLEAALRRTMQEAARNTDPQHLPATPVASGSGPRSVDRRISQEARQLLRASSARGHQMLSPQTRYTTSPLSQSSHGHSPQQSLHSHSQHSYSPSNMSSSSHHGGAGQQARRRSRRPKRNDSMNASNSSSKHSQMSQMDSLLSVSSFHHSHMDESGHSRLDDVFEFASTGKDSS